MPPTMNKVVPVIFFLLTHFQAWSQPIECIGFEGLENGALYGASTGLEPGALMLEEEGVSVRLREFHYFDGSTDFWDVFVTDDIFGDNFTAANGLYVFPSNINMEFDFMELADPTVIVCFDFFDGGGEENISVNGQPVLVLNNFFEAPQEIAPGVTLSVFLNNASNFPTGTVCLSGTIETLLVGGQELAIDNVCFVTSPDSDCEILEFTAEAMPCNDDDGFMVEIDFEHEGSGSIFLLKVNGEFYGQFPYSELPIQIGPFPGNTGESLHFYVAGQNTGCEAEADLEPVWCTDECIITNIIVEAHPCENDEFYIDLAFDSHNTGPLGFFVFADGMISGPHSYDEPFITLGPFEGDGANVLDFLILDISNPACFGYVEFGPVDCQEECHIFDVIAEAHPCTPNGVFFVDIAFGFENVGNAGYQIVGNGQNYGTFSYDEPFPTLGPFPGNSSTVLEFVVIDLENPNCSDFAVVEPVDCNNAPCQITELAVTTGDCNNDGTYSITIDFDYANPGNNFFEVFNMNNEPIGFFPLSQLPVTIQHFEGDGGSHDAIKVCINDQPNCCKVREFAAPDCGGAPCQITELAVTTGDCNNDGTYSITIDFDYADPGNDFFEVFNVNNEPIGYFPLSELPVTISHFQGGGGSHDAIKVCINDQPDCCKVREFAAPDCGGSGCMFTELTVEANCLPGEDVYELTIDFHFNAPPNSNTLFHAYTQSGFQGYFYFSDLPHSILSPYPESGEDVLTICLANHPDCCVEIAFAISDCDEEICIELDEFGNNAEPSQLAGPDDAGAVIHVENDVVIRAAELVVPGAALLNQVTVTPTQLCDFNFEAASGPRWYLEGAIELDFSDFAVKPDFVRFDYAYCPGTDGINLGVNGETPFWGFFNQLPQELPGGIQAIVVPANNTGTQGTVMLYGEIELLLIGGIPVHIDNICFSGAQPDEEVWPGDANVNNQADHYDLLNIGLAFGEEGPPRNETNVQWTGIPAADWNLLFADGTNFKHADCNGDGVVDLADRAAIEQNYGLTHGTVIPVPTLPGTVLDPPIFLDFPDPNETSAGAPFEVPIILGTQDNPMHDVYGVAFTVVLNPEVFDLNSLTLSYPASWFGSPNLDVITIDRFFPDEGRIEIAITRIDQTNTSGYGPIAYLRGIIDDIAGIRETLLRIEGVRAISNDENLLPVFAPVQKLQIVPGKQTIGKIDLQRNLRVFPNPTTGWVTIRNKYSLPIDEVEILDGKGQRTMPALQFQNQVSMHDLPAGIYMFRIRIGEIWLYQKVVKVN
jgi:hypothetical protein